MLCCTLLANATVKFAGVAINEGNVNEQVSEVSALTIESGTITAGTEGEQLLLTFEGVTLSYNENISPLIDLDDKENGFVIRVKGENNIKTGVFLTDKNASISYIIGDKENYSSLNITLTSSMNAGMKLNDGLNIASVDMKIIGGSNNASATVALIKFMSENIAHNYLSVKNNANLRIMDHKRRATNTNGSLIQGLKKIMTGESYLAMLNATLKADGSIVTKDGKLARNIVFGNANEDAIGTLGGQTNATYIFGEMITKRNADDIIGDGLFSYDVENDVLIMNGKGLSLDVADYWWGNAPGSLNDANERAVIYSLDREKLDLEVNGYVFVKGTNDNVAIYINNKNEKVTISGKEGSVLAITGDANFASAGYANSLDIRGDLYVNGGVTLDVESMSATADVCAVNLTGNLNVNASTVSFKSKEAGRVFVSWTEGKNNINLTNAEIEEQTATLLSIIPAIPNDTVYFINTENWAEVNAYAWVGDGEVKNAEWPGEAAEKVADTKVLDYDVYMYVAKAGEYENVIFNNGKGAQTDNLTWTSLEYYAQSTKKWYSSLSEAEKDLAPQGIRNANVNANVNKRIVNGQLYIVRDGKCFNAIGAEVK